MNASTEEEAARKRARRTKTFMMLLLLMLTRLRRVPVRCVEGVGVKTRCAFICAFAKGGRRQAPNEARSSRRLSSSAGSRSKRKIPMTTRSFDLSFLSLFSLFSFAAFVLVIVQCYYFLIIFFRSLLNRAQLCKMLERPLFFFFFP